MVAILLESMDQAEMPRCIGGHVCSTGSRVEKCCDGDQHGVIKRERGIVCVVNT